MRASLPWKTDCSNFLLSGDQGSLFGQTPNQTRVHQGSTSCNSLEKRIDAGCSSVHHSQHLSGLPAKVPSQRQSASMVSFLNESVGSKFRMKVIYFLISSTNRRRHFWCWTQMSCENNSHALREATCNLNQGRSNKTRGAKPKYHLNLTNQTTTESSPQTSDYPIRFTWACKQDTEQAQAETVIRRLSPEKRAVSFGPVSFSKLWARLSWPISHLQGGGNLNHYKNSSKSFLGRFRKFWKFFQIWLFAGWWR